MSITRRGLAWAALAVLGIVIAVALAWSVSRLAGQRIGLSSVSPTVVGRLVPPPRGHGPPYVPAPSTATGPGRVVRPGPATTADDGGDTAGGGAQRDD
jgi:hypothetical protein